MTLLSLLISLALAAPSQQTTAVIAASEVASLVPAEVSLVEAIAVDRGRLFAGSVVDGGLWRQTASGWRKLAAALPAGPILSLAVDRRARILWASIGDAEPYSGPARRFRGVVGLHLHSFKEMRRVAMPAGAVPSDIAIAADGTLYVSDPVQGGVYRCPPRCAIALPLLRKEVAPSPQGLAPAPGGSLYVADYSRGLLRVDPATGADELLADPDGVELRGIDGLVWWRGRLMGIQNGTKTRRILRVDLDAAGRSVTSVTPVEQAHPDWGEPTLTVVDGDRLLYVADAQWEAWEKGGIRKPDNPRRPTAIRRLDLTP